MCGERCADWSICTRDSSELRGMVLNKVLRQLSERLIELLTAFGGLEEASQGHNVLNLAQPLPHLPATGQVCVAKGINVPALTILAVFSVW